MERVCRLTGDRLSPGHSLTSRRQLAGEDIREWAKHAHGSRLYVELCEVVAGSDALLRILNRIVNRPRPNVFFAAVHYLLMRGEGPELARFYPSLNGGPEPRAAVGPPFREFVVSHEEEIVELGRTRYTQTNECRRCVALLPAIWRSGLSRFHLVDLGTSAGLNLLVDLYHYRWDGIEWGPDSPVTLETELRGPEPKPREIQVLSRTGLDLNPIDPRVADDRLWLEALIWPEHEARRQRLRAALEFARAVDMQFVGGSALETLGSTLGDLPDAEPAVVINSFTLNQFPREAREEVDQIVTRARGSRPITRVAFEHRAREDRWPKLSVDDGSGEEMLGIGHPHGEWVEFYARP
jgi:hypothetical protein